LFEKVGLNKREAKDMVEAFLRGNSRRAGNGVESVKLSGFGNFQLRDKAAAPRAAIPRLARKFPSAPAAWLPSTPARS